MVVSPRKASRATRAFSLGLDRFSANDHAGGNRGNDMEPPSFLDPSPTYGGNLNAGF